MILHSALLCHARMLVLCSDLSCRDRYSSYALYSAPFSKTSGNQMGDEYTRAHRVNRNDVCSNDTQWLRCATGDDL